MLSFADSPLWQLCCGKLTLVHVEFMGEERRYERCIGIRRHI